MYIQANRSKHWWQSMGNKGTEKRRRCLYWRYIWKSIFEYSRLVKYMYMEILVFGFITIYANSLQLDNWRSFVFSNCKLALSTTEKGLIDSSLEDIKNQWIFRKIASSNTSRLDADECFFRLLMMGIFYPYVLWPFDKKLIF